MTMRTRLFGAVLAILAFFSLNLGVHVWGDRARGRSLAELRHGIDRQLLISSIARHLSETHREIGLMAGVLDRQGAGPADPGVSAEFSARLDKIGAGRVI